MPQLSCAAEFSSALRAARDRSHLNQRSPHKDTEAFPRKSAQDSRGAPGRAHSVPQLPFPSPASPLCPSYFLCVSFMPRSEQIIRPCLQRSWGRKWPSTVVEFYATQRETGMFSQAQFHAPREGAIQSGPQVHFHNK